jgi:hypothetical protein
MAIRTDWRIGKKGRSCAGCGAAFPFEAPFHSAIWAEGEAFRRADLCDACYAAAPSPPYSHWIASIPKPDDRRRVFDLGLAAEFLRDLAGAEDPARAPLAHLLALLLVRKRIVRLADLPPGEGGPRARVEFHDGRPPLEIPAPPLTEDDVPALREELGRLLDLGGNDAGPPGPSGG